MRTQEINGSTEHNAICHQKSAPEPIECPALQSTNRLHLHKNQHKVTHCNRAYMSMRDVSRASPSRAGEDGKWDLARVSMGTWFTSTSPTPNSWVRYSTNINDRLK